MGQPYKVLYASTFATNDIRKWSGLVHHIAKALEDQNLGVDKIGPLKMPHKLANLARGKIHRALHNVPYPVERTLRYAASCSRSIAAKLDKRPYDVVFSPGSIPLALLDHHTPSIIYTDATFKIVLEQYAEMKNYPERYLREGMELENKAMQNADALVFSSQWAANSAVEHHGASPSKVHVVPFGSNLSSVPSRQAVHQAIDTRSRDLCELLFFAVRWKPKGGPLLLKVADLLWKKGVPVRVTMVGCEPDDISLPAHVQCEGFIDRSTSAGLQRSLDLILRSHFLVLPTRIDCTPVVFSECAALGVPCLSSKNVGGIEEIIRSNINGETFAINDAEAYVEYIAEQWNGPSRYADLARSTRKEYDERLNWASSGEALARIIHQVASTRGQ